MKKIVRLTESDLVKLVKRVINEQISLPGYTGGMTQVAGGSSSKTTTSPTNIAPEIMECAKEFGIKTLINYPNCAMAFTKVFTTGNKLTDQELDLCSDELQKNGIPLQNGINVVGCLVAKHIAKKIGF
jgi:hypothetical protein